MNNNKIAKIGLGLTAASASLLSAVSPAGAASPAVPSCTTLNAHNDTGAAARIKSYNTSATNVLKTKSTYKKLLANVTKAEKAVTAAKKKKGAAKTKALAAANKSLASAKSARDAAINAVTLKLNTATFTPNPVAAEAGSPAVADFWNWGVYKTRVISKNKAVVDICVTVDETNAKSENDVLPTAQNLEDSVSAYQTDNLALLRTEALTGAKVSRAVILGRVNAKIVEFGGAAAVTTNGYTTIGAGTGATYTVEGFYNSLQAALVASPVKA